MAHTEFCHPQKGDYGFEIFNSATALKTRDTKIYSEYL